MTETSEVAPTPEPEQLLTLNQVAALFVVTNETVRAWIRRGELRAMKIGNQWRVSRDEVRRFGESKYGDG